jgi:hypothetical protein
MTVLQTRHDDSRRRRRRLPLLLPLNVDQINEEATLTNHTHRHLLNDTEDSMLVLSQRSYNNINDATNATFRQELRFVVMDSA